MDLAILVPVLHRPHRVEPLLESIEANTTGHRVVFLATPGDNAEHDAIAAAGAEMILVDWRSRGDYARKINTAVRLTGEPYVFLGADDLRFHRGWFDRAAERMQTGVGVVGTNDLCNPRVMRGEHATHCLVARWYTQQGTVDDATKVLHEGYPHEFVDDEFVGTARKRDAFAFARDSVVEHLHPMAGKSPMDALYEGQKRRMRTGRPIFERRRRLWM